MSLLDLGDIYVSDFLAPDEQPRADPFPLELVMNDEGVVHLTEQPPAELMWGRYWYRSGTNQSMHGALADVVGSILDVVPLEQGDAWLDIACNDGTLLSYLPEGVYRVGVDPCEGEIAEQARKFADEFVQAPFSFEAVEGGFFTPFRVITCIAMFYDLLDPSGFLADVHRCLARDGVFVVQMSYTPLMLEQLAFDNVCHEHARYYSLATLNGVLRRAGFRIVDARLNDVNGGSIRVYAMRADGDPAAFGSAPFRDVASFRIDSLLDRECIGSYNQAERWKSFERSVMQLRDDVRTLIGDEVAVGKTVYGYGASTKGNTLLQFFGLDASLITAIAERQPGKVGLRTVGTDIPIVSEDEARAACPDYMLMLPWHFVDEFTRRESAYLEAGGRFIVPCPKLEVVTA